MNRIKMPGGGSRRLLRNFSANVDMRFDDAVLAEGTASKISGFDVTDGALTDGYGVEDCPEYSGKKGQTVWQFTRYDNEANEYKTCNMYCDVNGYVHYNYGDGWVILQHVSFSTLPDALTYRLYGDDSLIMTSPTDKMFVWDGVSSAQRIIDCPFISSMTMHYERMFATTPGESNAVYYSDDLDPTNWNASSMTEGGYVQLLDERGKLLKVVDFLDYVYVFREYGISRMTAYADQMDFRVANLYVSGGRIYPGSVCVCGDTVMLLASDGLYSFDGYNVTKRLKTVKFLPSPHSTAVYADGKYYLSACIENEGENDTLVVYDLGAGTFTLSPLSIKKLCKAGENVYAIMNDNRIGKVTKCGSVFGQPYEKVWESGETDMQSGEVKTISLITARSDGNATLTLTADGKRRTFELTPGGGITRIKPTVSGKVFRFRLSSSETDANISRLGYTVRGG